MRLSQEQFDALQAKSQEFHVARSKHRPRPNTVLISEAAMAKGGTWSGGVTAPQKKTKFKNIRCQAKDGTNFASRLERYYYEQLLLRWKAGDVHWFTRQIPFWLEGGVKFVVDFMVIEDYGVPPKFVDTTGVLTQTKINKLKQLKARYGIDVEIVTK